MPIRIKINYLNKFFENGFGNRQVIVVVVHRCAKIIRPQKSTGKTLHLMSQCGAKHESSAFWIRLKMNVCESVSVTEEYRELMSFQSF